MSRLIFRDFSIQTALDGDATEDVITISADLEEQPVALMEKPGAKHQKLRGELQHQILQRRSELWQHKTVTCPKPNVDENKLNGGVVVFCFIFYFVYCIFR